MLHFLQSGPSRCSGKTPANLRSREAAFSCRMRTGAACSFAQLCLTSLTAARQASLSVTNSQGLLKLMPIGSVMPSNHLILCHPLLFLPSIFPSIRVFSNESWSEYWNFYLSIISPSSEYSGFIFFKCYLVNVLPPSGGSMHLLPSALIQEVASESLIGEDSFIYFFFWSVATRANIYLCSPDCVSAAW